MKLPTKSHKVSSAFREIDPLNASRVFAHPNNIEWCNWIADFLEIEADGGDNPGEFVRWCFIEMYKQQRIEMVQRKVDWLEDWDGA